MAIQRFALHERLPAIFIGIACSIELVQFYRSACSLNIEHCTLYLFTSINDGLTQKLINVCACRHFWRNFRSGSLWPFAPGGMLLRNNFLTRIWFIFCRLPCRRIKQVHSDVAPRHRHRVGVAELAIGGHTGFSVCRYEVDRGGVNYTFETLAALREQEPARELFFLLGGDMFYDLPNWREPNRVCELALPVPVRRAGGPALDFSRLASGIASAERVEEMRITTRVEMPDMGLAQAIFVLRRSLRKSLRYRTPRAVEKYIEVKKLYLGD